MKDKDIFKSVIARRHLMNAIVVAISASTIGLLAWLFPLDQAIAYVPSADFRAIAAVFVLTSLMIALVGVRFYALARLFSFRPPLLVALRAGIAGLVAGLLVLNIVGSVVGRHTVLRRILDAPGILAAIAVIERGLAGLIAGGLSLAGGIYLFGSHDSLALAHDLRLVEIAITLALIWILAVYVLGSASERRLFKRLPHAAASWSTFVLVLLFLLQQVLAISAFYVAARGVGIDIASTELIAAAAVITFIASLPISVNGWGVRELASVLILQQLGVPEASALAASIILGLTATVTVMLSGALLLRRSAHRSGAAAAAATSSAVSTAAPVHGFDRPLTLLAGLCAAALIFFQIRITIFGNPLSVNLADPIAIAGVAVGILLLVRNTPLTRAAPAPFLLWLAGLTSVIAVSFVLGWLQFGATTWSLSNRLLGWPLLIGYAFVGGALVYQFGLHGLRRLFLIFAIAGGVSAVVLTGLREYALLTGNFEDFNRIIRGFVLNRNAFALQLCVAAAGALAFAPTWRRAGAWRLHEVLMGCVFFGVWISQSKAGLVVLGALLVCFFVVSPDRRRSILVSLSAALAVAIAFHGIGVMVDVIVGESAKLAGLRSTSRTGALEVLTLKPAQLDERWISIEQGVRMWLENPIFGAGLGAFVHSYLSETGKLLVIHSTPVWFLAEMGVVGLVAAIWLPAVLLWRHCRSVFSGASQTRLLTVGLVLAILVFSLAHDIFYARIIWLIIGALAVAWRLQMNRARVDR